MISVLLTPFTALWPLFHYLLWQDVVTEYASADSHYPSYESANAVFARRIAEVYQPGDLIWVHDYHLLLVPKYVLLFSSVIQRLLCYLPSIKIPNISSFCLNVVIFSIETNLTLYSFIFTQAHP